MSIEYKWSISHANVKPEPHNGLDQVVASCRWAVTAIDGDVSDSTFGYVDFEDPNPDAFVAFRDVRQDAMLQWVWSSVDRQHIEDSLAAALEAKKQPSTVQTSIPE
jgi:hypothetical protein